MRSSCTDLDENRLSLTPKHCRTVVASARHDCPRVQMAERKWQIETDWQQKVDVDRSYASFTQRLDARQVRRPLRSYYRRIHSGVQTSLANIPALSPAFLPHRQPCFPLQSVVALISLRRFAGMSRSTSKGIRANPHRPREADPP